MPLDKETRTKVKEYNYSSDFCPFAINEKHFYQI